VRQKLAVQMFTLREFTKTADDFAETLDKVAKMGYPAVQLSAVGCMNGDTPEVSAEQARGMLDDRGLRCVATHRSWDALTDETDKEIEFHQALGCEFAAIGGIPGPYRSEDGFGFARFAYEAQATIAKLKAAGIRFGYHNHAFEFKRIQGDGTWYDALINEGGSDLCLEIDTYWAMHGGVYPATLFRRCAGRVPVVHLKDRDVKGNDGIFAPIGEGNLDWEDILPAAEAAGVEWYCIEQDNCYDRDPFDCLRSSLNFLAAQSF